jgi:REP element-mobilizing transposase RayT
MSTAYKFGNQTMPYFVTFATVQWMDVFVRSEYVKILLDSLAYCQKEKGLILHAWCIMPSHLHLIMSTEQDAMQNILRDYKRFTAIALLDAIAHHPGESRKEWMLWMFERASVKEKHQFWQHDNHPIELVSQSFFDQKLAYIHENPVKAGFVEQGHHWHWSSARNYANRSIIGPLPLVFAGW